MTVDELIKELSKCKPNAIINVRVDYREGELCEVVKINKNKVELIG